MKFLALSRVVLSSLALTLSSLSVAQTVADEKAKTLSQTCAACHGVDGVGIAPNFPNLAGQHPAYLLKQLKDLKANEKGEALRLNAVMSPQAAALSVDDMKVLGDYYGAMPAKIGTAAKPEMKILAQGLYRGGDAVRGIAACAGCHGPAGSGIPARYPRLAGQSAEYIKSSLMAFRSGERKNDPEGMMRGSAKLLSDVEIEALADYISGLKLANATAK